MTSSTMKRIGMSILTAICLLTFVAPSVATPLQTPPDEQNPWLCYDLVGWERPCTVTEEWVLCKLAAQDAKVQCERAADDADDFDGSIICYMRYIADEKACDAEVVGLFWFF